MKGEGYDGNIQGCRLPTLPIWEIDIGRTALFLLLLSLLLFFFPTPHLVGTKGVSS